ncbi:MAG: glycosidase [Candidatus Brocadiia bacterium]
MQEPFVRSRENPLITVTDLAYQANTVFNAGAADLGDEVLLLVRVESCSGRSHLIVARSDDGVTNWRFEDHALLHAAEGRPEEEHGVEDPRLTWMDDLDAWIITYTAYGPEGAGIALAKTSDFSSVERLGMIFPPEDKNGVLFPERFDGSYAMLHRPGGGRRSVWMAYSPDMVHWGNQQVVLPVRGGPWWDGVRVGAGMTPIKTEDGWLLIYHGVKELAGDPIYRLGAALTDLEKPHRLMARARRWLLSPQRMYERFGDAGNVLFTCGGFVRGEEVWCYYGAADSSICLARAKVSDILNLVEEEPV